MHLKMLMWASGRSMKFKGGQKSTMEKKSRKNSRVSWMPHYFSWRVWIYAKCTPCVEDGEMLLMLVMMGSMEQYKACGLSTVKDQMKLSLLVTFLAPQQALHHHLVHHSQAQVATVEQHHHQGESFLRKCFRSCHLRTRESTWWCKSLVGHGIHSIPLYILTHDC